AASARGAFRAGIDTITNTRPLIGSDRRWCLQSGVHSQLLALVQSSELSNRLRRNADRCDRSSSRRQNREYYDERIHCNLPRRAFGQEMMREQILVQLTYIKGPIRDLVRSMHIIFVTVACITAALIAGTAPVRAQTLPVYDVDAETAKCLTQAETGKQWMDALKSWCRSGGQEER